MVNQKEPDSACPQNKISKLDIILYSLKWKNSKEIPV